MDAMAPFLTKGRFAGILLWHLMFQYRQHACRYLAALPGVCYVVVRKGARGLEDIN